MASSHSVFNFNQTSDVEIVQRLLFDDNGEREDDFEDDCDSSEEEVIENREGDSETTESDEECKSPLKLVIFYTGKDKITKWKYTCPKQNVRTRRQNLLTRLPAVNGDTKECRTLMESWNCFFTPVIITEHNCLIY